MAQRERSLLLCLLAELDLRPVVEGKTSTGHAPLTQKIRE